MRTYTGVRSTHCSAAVATFANALTLGSRQYLADRTSYRQRSFEAGITCSAGSEGHQGVAGGSGGSAAGARQVCHTAPASLHPPHPSNGMTLRTCCCSRAAMLKHCSGRHGLRTCFCLTSSFATVWVYCVCDAHCAAAAALCKRARIEGCLPKAANSAGSVWVQAVAAVGAEPRLV